MRDAASVGVVLGVDVGGTFTDVVLVRGSDILLEKVLTTPDDPSIAIIDGCLRALRRMNTSPRHVRLVLHATTVVVNSLIERKGAVTGLLTTRGFRDVLEIGNEQRYHIYDLNIDKPTPLVPRRFRKGITERILADGSVHIPLARDEVAAVTQELVQRGVHSIAVCLLNAHVNPAHEEAIAALLADRFPALDVSLSSRIAPEVREWERMSTTVANAFVRPLCKRYLENLSESLLASGISSEFQVMVSSGGIASPDMAREHPIRLLESGPAAGVMAASFYSRTLENKNVIAFDMGGTTAKICLIANGKPRRARQFEVARADRFQRGSGLPIKIPVIELIDIGAGGGSIARADAMGLLKVGPDSSGARPGPACYGQGGSEPTVTDADLLLGYLNPDFFLGGAIPLDLASATRAVKRLGERLGISVTDAARGIYEVVNENMAIATRVHAVEQGEDPRKYDLIAFGGAGPVHAYEVARKLKLKRVICPLGAGTLSALGLLVAPRAVEFVHSYACLLNEIDWKKLRRIFDDMRERATSFLLQTGLTAGEIRYRLSADMRYWGQGFEIEVPFDAMILTTRETTALVQKFEKTYTSLFGRTVPKSSIEALAWRLQAEAPPHVSEVTYNLPPVEGDPCKGNRQVFFPELGAFTETPVYDRYRLRPGRQIAGPCVIEERESTVVLGSSATIQVDQYLNLILTIVA